jgi:two-component system, NarL family, sensor histidine kinase UhpB
MENELKLLLLEDSPDDAEYIQQLLRRSGLKFSANVVSDEKEFLSALDDNSYDAVLADNALPQYSSLEALDMIQQRNPFTAFILVTGTVSEEFAVNIIQRGADDYILKTNLTRPSSAIKKAISTRKMQREKTLAEEGLLKLNEQLRGLTARMQEVREEEQARIAREIHDELGQMLTAVKMDISAANKKLAKVAVEDARVHLSDAMELVDSIIQSVRKIASELRPGVLDDLGLEAALEWQSQEFEKHNPEIKCDFSSRIDDIPIEKNIATGLYRIYQESLTNIARHSGATAMKATLLHSGNLLILTVTDNGKGFVPEEIKNKKTLGLVGMKERAILIGGELMIENQNGKGTKITVCVPYK